MSDKSKKTKPKKRFSYTAQGQLPKLSAIKTEWDLKKHFYKSEKDERIEKDVLLTEAALLAFAKKYSNGTWTKSVKGILTALRDFLALQGLPGDRPLYYFSYRHQLNASDIHAEKHLNKLSERMTKAENGILFFPLQLARLPVAMQKQLLAAPEAKQYLFYLNSLFADAKHQRSEAEEKILNLKALTSRSLWTAGTEKIVNKKTISWKGKEIPINGALMQFTQLPQKERHQMWRKIVAVLESVGEVAENELVALALDKKISDELRGYEKPYSSTTKEYDSSDETLEKLVSVIETRGYKLSRRFYALKKKLLKKELTYIDRDEPIGEEIKVDLETAITVCRDVFYNFDSEYGAFFDSMLTGGCIDVWPKAGKGSGAFCSSGVNMPTMVFLNHNDSLESLRTLAHEMGHAVHAWRSKSQPMHYQGHSILTAETASTFFEALAIERVLTTVKEQDALSILSGMIGDRISTMIMCIARFKFELEMHETIRREGGMSWQEMAAGLARHFAAYTGPSIKTLPEHGTGVISKVHYRMNFYQYSYSFGEIGSSIMRSRFESDESYRVQIDHFLSLGDSASVEDIFNSVGIDMSKEETFHQGLDLLEADIDRFSALAKKLM